MINSIGMLEFRSIGKGIEAADALCKAASIELILSRTTCPGKFMIFIAGEVGAVTEALDKGKAVGKDYLVDSFILPAVHEEVINGMKNKYKQGYLGAIGVLETNNIASGVFALDKALKAAEVSLIKLNLGLAIGGKCYFVISGDVSSVEEALSEGIRCIDNKRVISNIIIPSPSEELLKTL